MNEDKDRKIEELIKVYGIGSTFDEIMNYSVVDGAIDLRKMRELEGRYGHNGGMGCDVLKGPCSCGAWH